MTPIEQAIEALKQVESQASTRTMKGELVYVSNFPEIRQAIAELENLNQRKCAECGKEDSQSVLVPCVPQSEKTCENCKHDGNQMIFCSGCTGCNPCGDQSFLRHWEQKNAK